MNQNLSHSRGFSLVELSIAILIIGAVVVLVMASRDLSSMARAKAVMIELIGYQEAIENFETRYNTYPGDFVRHAAVFSDANATNASLDALATLGNGAVDHVTEREYFWPQLRAAGYIQQRILPVATPASTVRVIGTNRPESYAIDRGGWTWVDSYCVDDGSNAYSFANVLRMGGYVAGSSAGGEYLEQPVLEMAYHRYIDAKIDTPNTPLSGVVTVGSDVEDDVDNGCIDTNPLGGEPVYELTDDENCVLNYVGYRSVAAGAC